MPFFVIESSPDRPRFWAVAHRSELIVKSGMDDASPLWGVFSTTLQEELEASGYSSLCDAWAIDVDEAAALSRIAEIACSSPVGRVVTIHRGTLIERLAQSSTFNREHWRAIIACEYIVHGGGKIFDSWVSVTKAGYSHHPILREVAEQVGEAQTA